MATRSPSRRVGQFVNILSAWQVTDYQVFQRPHWMATLRVPGLNYESFDRNGAPKLSSILNLGSTARIYTLNIPYDDGDSTFLDWRQLTQSCLTFISSVKVTISKSMYDFSVPKHSLIAKFHHGYVGNTSTASPIELFVPGDTRPLYEQIHQIVTVGKGTRRPQPLPDWFKEKYQGNGVMSGPYIVKPKPRPQDAFLHQMQVQWSHTDVYEHTNFISYPIFAIDCVHAALWNQDRSSRQVLKGLTHQIVNNGLKSVEICYLRECLQGDVLDVHVWQEDESVHKVYCSMYSHGAELCQVWLEYFDH